MADPLPVTGYSPHPTPSYSICRGASRPGLAAGGEKGRHILTAQDPHVEPSVDVRELILEDKSHGIKRERVSSRLPQSHCCHMPPSNCLASRQHSPGPGQGRASS